MPPSLSYSPASLLLFTQCKTIWLAAISSRCLVALQYVPRCLLSTVTGGKTPNSATLSEPLNLCCHVLKFRNLPLQTNEWT